MEIIPYTLAENAGMNPIAIGMCCLIDFRYHQLIVQLDMYIAVQ